jgi:hypothetical protein
MHNDTIQFAAPLVGLCIGAAILVGSLFITGLSVVSIAGGVIGIGSIAALGYAVARSADELPSVDIVERERDRGDDGLERARGAK